MAKYGLWPIINLCHLFYEPERFFSSFSYRAGLVVIQFIRNSNGSSFWGKTCYIVKMTNLTLFSNKIITNKAFNEVSFLKLKTKGNTCFSSVSSEFDDCWFSWKYFFLPKFECGKLEVFLKIVRLIWKDKIILNNILV